MTDTRSMGGSRSDPYSTQRPSSVLNGVFSAENGLVAGSNGSSDVETRRLTIRSTTAPTV
ncbi:hypothetical protein [Halalkalicoccus salilacus]|uniref:hypothetical protein n=1 Tax=Halalkalicoccus sp. GCM10025704 TaxID=3252662 RepID=UPI00360C3846